MIQIKNNNLKVFSNNHFKNLYPILIKRLAGKKGRVFDFVKKHLEEIITAQPYELVNNIINKIPSISGVESDISKIFSYNAFVKAYSNKSYGAYALAQKLNIRVCPYCNRQYTFTIQTKDGKTRPEFDHFFSQEKYPYLALSFFNLIPSCHICNSNLKGTKEFNLDDNIHPYIDGFENEIKFRIKFRNKNQFKKDEVKKLYGVNFYNGALESFDIKIKVENPINALELKANRNIEVFHLEALYNEHKDHVVELVQKAEIYNPDYIETLFKEYEGKLFNDRHEIYRMILSNYTSSDDLDKRVLSKLTRDISLELGIIP